MKKLFVIGMLLTMLMGSLPLIVAAEPVITYDMLTDANDQAEGFVDGLGQGLLRVQAFLLGTVSFLSGGTYEKAGSLGLHLFLLALLVFFVVHSGLSYVTNNGGINFLLATASAIATLIFVPATILERLYAAEGVTSVLFSTILPTIIIIWSTARASYRIYVGKSRMSPLKLSLINMAVMLWFGVFYIRYSHLQGLGWISIHAIAGYILITLGLINRYAYRLLAHSIIKDRHAENTELLKERKEQRELIMKARKMKLQAEGLDL